MPHTDIEILPKAVELQLNRLLQLPATGGEQDWAIELADKNRIAEFLDFHSTTELNEMEHYGVGLLLLASYNDYLTETKDTNNDIWSHILVILAQDEERYTGVLRYWACFGKIADDKFAISDIIKTYLGNEEERNIKNLASFFGGELKTNRSVSEVRPPRSFIRKVMDAVFGELATSPLALQKVACTAEEITALERHHNLRLPKASFQRIYSIYCNLSDNNNFLVIPIFILLTFKT